MHDGMSSAARTSSADRINIDRGLRGLSRRAAKTRWIHGIPFRLRVVRNGVERILRARSKRCQSRIARQAVPRAVCVTLLTMPATPEPVRPIALAEIRAARERIAHTIVRTPLVRLEMGPEYPEIRLKLETLQAINAYKLRGAANAVAMLSESERRRGVWTISAGNAGQGVAYAARIAGVPCTVVAIETAPAAKLDRMRALGAKLILVPYATAWKALDDRAYPGAEGTFVHPFDDHQFIAGHGTMGLEILEDAPDTAAVIASIGGGGLITGVGSALKALKPDIKIWGAEPETAAPVALSLAAGSPQAFKDWKASFVDGAGGQSVFPRMWERMKSLIDGSIVVTLEETRRAMRLMAEKTRVISEGAGALPLAAALTGKAGRGPIVAIVSGGNIDLQKFSELIST
ncbi:MAG: pyridoxal-phosphate dependent enzyme [Candidatus Eisenbacteria bacterium]|uniref:Pyridoxal-phosphate dependent enzyme n=1 Tax=Eiseniibacteriota bacterium TaxID=2212470 RepID=A0A538TYI1_UNCEI|nr:MAG: pyridoxal-phosphate dependent enzyme [Candidatus Eisenbacteria bacterium]